MESIDSLIHAASEARLRAYAPYSGYKVGAAIRSSSGQIYSGCNVENVAYPATICAERTALVKMVSAGEREMDAMALVTEDGGTPCGICLQVLSEFAPEPERTVVYIVDAGGRRFEKTLAELFPYGFKSSAVERTETSS